VVLALNVGTSAKSNAFQIATGCATGDLKNRRQHHFLFFFAVRYLHHFAGRKLNDLAYARLTLNQ
jgi:hypothetical protein